MSDDVQDWRAVLDGRREWAVVLGDCLDVLRELPAGSVDAVVTDPPYAVPTVVAQGREVTRNVGDLSLVEATFRGVVEEWARIVGDDGRVFVFCDGTSYPAIFRASYSRFSTALLVWDKGRIGMGREFRKSHELILHGWRGGTPVFTDGVGRADVLRVPPVGNGRAHPAEKPVGLIADLLRVSGGLILDPFAGSGTTGVACLQTGRRFIGVEIDPTYHGIAVDRLTKAAAARQPMLTGFEASA